jgi:hypothetical protein
VNQIDGTFEPINTRNPRVQQFQPGRSVPGEHCDRSRRQHRPRGRHAFEGVVRINVATNTVEQPIAVEGYPTGIAVTPGGNTADVAVDLQKGNSVVRGAVIPIATATNTPGKPIPVVSVPSDLAITPDGKTIFVANPYVEATTILGGLDVIAHRRMTSAGCRS